MDRQLNIEKAIDFLLASIDQKTKGSTASYSRILYPFKGWSAPYPETTGYLIATFLDLASRTKYAHLKTPATEMANWICSMQTKEGGLPGGLYRAGKEMEKSIFNTAQMLIGLVAAANFTKENDYLTAAHRAGVWLMDTQETNGTWTKYHYHKGFFPSYYTRVAWPLLQIAQLTGDEKLEKAALKTYDTLLTKVQSNKFIKDAGFQPDSYAFLHTIAYTIRGFLEGAILANRDDYWEAGYNLAYKLLRKYELKKRLAGAYYSNFKEINWYRCLTGEAQMGIIWLKIFGQTSDIRFVNTASKLLDELCATQPMKNGLFLKAGGLKGSHPYFGRYMAFRQPNWATKFFLDALLAEEKTYHWIEHQQLDGIFDKSLEGVINQRI